MYTMIADAKIRQFSEKHGDEIRRLVAGTGVRAVLVMESTLRLRPDRQWWHDGMLSWVPTTRDDEQADPLFEVFYNAARATTLTSTTWPGFACSIAKTLNELLNGW